MKKRQLKRQLNLGQVVMLGSAGTIGAEIFVLTGHAVGIAGPALLLALFIGGLLCYSIALNYCELATTYPETGGAMTYVREAWGKGLASFLVGSMDCISSTFYCALSAVGFAYSLQIFFPSLPIVGTAIFIIVLFTLLNIFGVTNVGNVQNILGGMLLTILLGFVVIGFLSARGFHWDVFLPQGQFFIYKDSWTNLNSIFRSIALIFAAYIGFEVIADDAEEIKDPDKNIPRGILISLTLIILVYMLVTFVTLGVVPWQQMAGSETALSDAVKIFIPGWGAPVMAIAGITATLTSINASMLSATREAFTLSRDEVWPRALARLSRFRTPFIAILFVGFISVLVASLGIVDFLSYICSAGYLYVLFNASLAMVTLHKKFPDIRRPFKVAFFPLTAYMAAGACVFILFFTDWKALVFGVGVLVVGMIYYYSYRPLGKIITDSQKAASLRENRILVPIANPQSASRLMCMASILARAVEDTSIHALAVAPQRMRFLGETGNRLTTWLDPERQRYLDKIANESIQNGEELFAELVSAPNVAQGILETLEKQSNVKLILAGWPGALHDKELSENPVNKVLLKARTNVAVLLDRGIENISNILVPVGGGIHSRLAIQLAHQIAHQNNSRVTALRIFETSGDADDIEDQALLLQEIIEEELGEMPANFNLKVVESSKLIEGIMQEIKQENCDLLIIGASEEWAMQTRLFGSVDDWIAEKVDCSVLMVRRFEPVAMAWIKLQVKRLSDNHST